MPKFNEYTEKTNPDDADIFLLQDVVSTKKTTFLGIFNQIRTKLGLGALANKNKVSQSDLEDALTEFINGKLTASGIADDLNTTDITKVLSAPQGKALLGYIGTLSSLSTAQKTNLVVAINEVVTSVATLNSNLGGLRFEHQLIASVTDAYSADNVLSFSGSQLYPGSFQNCVFLALLNSAASTGKQSVYLIIMGAADAAPVLIKIDGGSDTLYPKLAKTSSNRVYAVWSTSATAGIHTSLFKLY